MISLFKNKIYFSVLFAAVLFIDIAVKIYLEDFPYRYISKPIVLSLLIGFYLVNNKETNKKKSLYVLLGLLSFLIGDIFVIDYSTQVFFIVSMLLFSLGKLFYCLKFTNFEDFNVNRLIPFLIICFIFMVFIFRLIYENLGDYFIPVLIYFFVSLLLALFSFLRKNATNVDSYRMVFLGILFFLVSETVMVLKTFYHEIIFQDFLVMFTYGVAQYLIVTGLLLEYKIK